MKTRTTKRTTKTAPKAARPMTDREVALHNLKLWKRDIATLESHIAQLQINLDRMRAYQHKAEDLIANRDYDWVTRELYRIAPLF